VELFVFVAASVVIFTTIIVGLVAMLMVAKRQLVAEGELPLLLNDEKTVMVEPGQTLLNALTASKIFLPSACGGGGTCAMCKCQVFEGGGDVLPTETPHLNMRERKSDWRLACQVKVKEPMKLGIPEEVFGIKKWECEVISNKNVATFIKEFIVKLPEGEVLDFEPGGYIQIDVPLYECSFREFDIEEEYRDEWDKYKLWDLKAFCDEEGVYRAYSMGNYPAEGNIVLLNIRIATPPGGMDVPPGICSSYIFNCKPGDKCIVSGPYGEFEINHSDAEMVYIGGGAGMAPLRSQLFHLFHTLETRHRKITYWYGARSLREMFYWDQLKELEEKFDNFEFTLALSDPMPEDDFDGPLGFIHQVLYDNYLKDHEAPEDIEYYICGPPLMLSAVLKLLDDLGVPEENIRYDDFG
jgi:Na+-transporting NADH:ubiquinone oxidoreductase subunit F